MTATLPERGLEPTLLDGRYELGPLLGRGGMSDVHRARDRVTGQDVAVKLFRPGLELLDAASRRRREVQLLRSLEHPGLVRVLDAEHCERPGVGDAVYLVVELVDGITLGQLVRQGPRTEAEVLALGAALCAALEHVHERGIVHRDVKPANVLLAAAPDGGWTPKLTDFGIARVVDSTRMTVEGFTVGTPNYLSPEQVTGANVGTACDVYSLGLVLIEVLTGELVYPGHGVEAAVARLHRDPSVPAHVSAPLRTLLTAMTQRDPARRPTAREAGLRFERLRVDPGADLGLVVGDRGGDDGGDASGGRYSGLTAVIRTPRRRAAATLGLVGSLAAATVGTVLALSPQAAPSESQPVPQRATSSASTSAPVAAHSPAPARTTTSPRGAVVVRARPSTHRPAPPRAPAPAPAAHPKPGHGAKHRGPGHGKHH